MQDLACRITGTNPNPCDLINSGTQLKVLPSAVPQLLSSLSNDDLSYAELSTIIGQFPTIAARLIFLANSAWAAPVCEITSLDMACAKLGLSVVKSVSISIAIAAPFDPARCPEFKTQEFWASALLVADAAAWLADLSNKIPDDQISTVHTSALLHNLGLLWMADAISKETSEALGQVSTQTELTVAQLLQNYTGADYCEVGGCLAKAWNLPKPLESAMKNHLDFNYAGDEWPIAAVTGYAAKMVHALNHNIDELPEDLRLERLEIKSDQRDTVYSRLEGKNESVKEMVQILFC